MVPFLQVLTVAYTLSKRRHVCKFVSLYVKHGGLEDHQGAAVNQDTGSGPGIDKEVKGIYRLSACFIFSVLLLCTQYAATNWLLCC